MLLPGGVGGPRQQAAAAAAAAAHTGVFALMQAVRISRRRGAARTHALLPPPRACVRTCDEHACVRACMCVCMGNTVSIWKPQVTDAWLKGNFVRLSN